MPITFHVVNNYHTLDLTDTGTIMTYRYHNSYDVSDHIVFTKTTFQNTIV